MTDRSPRRRPSLTAVLLLTAAFFATHAAFLGRHGFWVDELHTFGAVRMGWGALVRERFAAGHMPTYFLLLKAWCTLTGFSEWSMRLPSVAAASLAFFGWTMLLRRFVADRRVFATGAALFFLHPFVYWASRDARMYAMLLAASVLSAWALLAWLERRDAGRPWAYMACVFAGTAFHLLFLFQIATHLTLLVAHRRDRLRRWAPFALAGLAPLLPLAFLTAARSESYGDGLTRAAPSLKSARKTVTMLTTDFERFGAGLPDWGEDLGKFLTRVFFVLFLVLAIARLRRWRRDTSDPAVARMRRLLRFCFYWMGVPALLMALSEALGNTKTGSERYYIPAVGSVLFLAALELGARDGALPRRVLRWSFAALGLYALVVQALWPGTGVREAFEALRARWETGETVVYTHVNSMEEAFIFYGAGHMNRVGATNPGAERRIEADMLRAVREGGRMWLLYHKDKESPFYDLVRKHGLLAEVEYRMEAESTELRAVRLTKARIRE